MLLLIEWDKYIYFWYFFFFFSNQIISKFILMHLEILNNNYIIYSRPIQWWKRIATWKEDISSSIVTPTVSLNSKRSKRLNDFHDFRDDWSWKRHTLYTGRAHRARRALAEINVAVHRVNCVRPIRERRRVIRWWKRWRKGEGEIRENAVAKKRERERERE